MACLLPGVAARGAAAEVPSCGSTSRPALLPIARRDAHASPLAAKPGGAPGLPRLSAASRRPVIAAAPPCTPRVVDAAPGGRFLDHYKLGGILGQGSFGIVYACGRYGAGPEEQLAVKMVDKVEMPESEIRREAELQLRLSHPNIVRVHQVFFEKCFVCILMDVCRGGDLIGAMESHWEQAGGINSRDVVHICRQMAVAVDYLCAQGIVHRDIKGDNFLLDRPLLSDPGCWVALGDFGTACEVQPGERLWSRVGTRNHWAPEVFRADYGFKADVWALGVVTYALLEGRFPFADDAQIMGLAPEFSEDLPEGAAGYVGRLLRKAEAGRPGAAEALGHPWLGQPPRPRGGSEAAEEAEADQSGVQRCPSGAALRERGPNINVNERRQELVRRMTAASARTLRRTTTVRRSTTLRRTTTRHGATPGGHSPNFWAGRFDAVDRRTGALRQMEWWPADRLRALGVPVDAWGPELAGLAGAAGEAPGERSGTTRRTVGYILARHGIDTNQFGRGVARTLDDLTEEIRTGASRLMLDASAHKKLVRVVDLVLLRVAVGTGDDADELVLVELGKEYSDGRAAAGLERLPATKREPHESTKRVVDRMLAQIFGQGRGAVRYSLQDSDVFETEDDSASYPGVRTVYRKELVKAHLVGADGHPLECVGGAGRGRCSYVDLQGSTHHLCWLTTAECASRGILQTAPEEAEGFSGLVPAPMGLDEEELVAYLRSNSVDTSGFGRNSAKSVEDLSTELVKGESSLRQQPDGRVLRVVDVILLKLERVDTGDLLIVNGEVLPGGQEALPRIHLPGGKRRPDENQFVAAQRILTNFLHIDENYVNFDLGKVTVFEEETDSHSYPGLRTLYRKRVISGEVLSPTSSGSCVSPSHFEV